jgi:hypothetical protein
MLPTNKMKTVFLILSFALILCSGRETPQVLQDTSTLLKVTISLALDRQFVYLQLCNASGQKIYLSSFHKLSTHSRIFRNDPSSGKYLDYQPIFNSIAMQIALDSIEDRRNFPLFQESKNHFADMTAKDLSEKLRNEETIDATLIGEPYEEFYNALMSVKYLDGFQCIEDTMDLSPIENEKGKYKIFMDYEVFPIPLKESLGSFMYKFYHDRMPSELKGYKRWEGKIVSDTIEFEVK